MTDPTKKVTNPLFNAAVIGSTYEDFTQNALLLPAKEKPPPPVLNISPEQILSGSSNPTDFFENKEILLPQEQQQFFQQPPLPPAINVPEVNLQPLVPQLEKQQNNSSFSAVYSSFSNILKIKSTPPTSLEEEVQVAAPAGIDTLINQVPVTDAPPVPLYPATGVNLINQPQSVPQGPVNTFRRLGTKRPAYAPVPGLSNINPTNPSFKPPAPTNYFIDNPSSSSSSPADSFASSNNQESTPFSLPNQFKPISPTPSNFTVPPQIPQPLPSIPPIFPNNTLQSPVMAAIPASEVLQNSNMNNSSSMYNFQQNSENSPSSTNPQAYQVYRPVYHHWFFKRECEGKTIWQSFSMIDSLALEEGFTSNDLDPDNMIATDGGRYDVNILRRQRTPVYWKGNPTEVRRCSWFHKNNSDGRFVPYEENVATRLEDEYKAAFEANQWNRKVELGNGENIVFHKPDVLVLFPPDQVPDAWSNSSPAQSKPRIVKRGMSDFDIDEGEPAKVDHLLFMVHGIGSVCDLKFRPVAEVVDEFRSIALQLVQSHYHSSCEKGIANRIEVLPISWHDQLHSEDTGIDKKLKSITLDSIPRLRDFTNDTLLDILFYTSPIYCQTIIATVGNELNRVYDLFKQRNPSFAGGVSLGGHSLGSLILFDLLGHQHPEPETEDANNGEDIFPPLNEAKPHPLQRRMSRRISYMMGSIGTGQPQIHYPRLSFQPKALFALGSPIGMFVTIRGLDTLGEQFALPTCPAFFNIFHPYDPIAYRVESLVNPDLSTLKPVLIPHHKGRKRMHLELKETMIRVGADLKQRVIDSMKTTWNSFYQLAMFHRQDTPSLEDEVNKAFQKQISEKEMDDDPQPEPTDMSLGILNKGRRIDYVLQEAPFEFINEYIFALTSHVCYWESEDTMLMILKEIYSSMDISSDSQIPQQTMTIERPPPSPTSSRSNQIVTPDISKIIGMDPTYPIQKTTNLQPPPTTGFVKKT